MRECTYDQSTMVFKPDGYKAYNHLTKKDLEKLSCEGVVAVGMRINLCIKHYQTGIIDDRKGDCGCSHYPGPNHAVALVGFGTDFDAPHGTCDKYWLLRNSWTDRWGEQGYFRMCRYDDGLRDGTCLIRHDAILPIMNHKFAPFK